MPKKVKARKNTKNRENKTVGGLLFKTDQQEYAKVTRMLGDRRVECECYDGIKRLCKIRGAIRKKTRIKVDDIVLLSLRDFQDDKADIIHAYTPDDVRKLQKEGQLPVEQSDLFCDVIELAPIDELCQSNQYDSILIDSSTSDDGDVIGEVVVEDVITFDDL